ncbi:MAG: putative secreted protein [Acidimicrobiales bacterium]|nr:putative secreted protein [Acidimicrobiales bacterium]
MSWEGPGFVDHHAHLLTVAVGRQPACCSGQTTEEIQAWHHLVLSRWSTPMDQPSEPLPVHDGTRGAIERGLHHARELGLVQVTEAGMEDWAYLEALLQIRARLGELPVRVRILVASGIADVKRMARTGDPWLELEGVKFYADGWIGTRTAALDRAYDDDDDAERGVLFLDADTLARRADPFAEAGWTIATHAIGDRAIATVLDAYEKIFGSDCAAAAPRIEHAQVLNDELVRRMASLGVVACIQPGFAVSDAADARRALGSRWDEAYHWDSLLDAGVRVIAGSDHPVESLAPLVGLHRLVTGDFEDGRSTGAPTLPLDVALDLMTDATAGTVVLSDDPHGREDELTSIEIEDVTPTG